MTILGSCLSASSAKKQTRSKITRNSFSISDYLEPVYETIKAAWNNKGKAAAAVLIGLGVADNMASKAEAATALPSTWHYWNKADLNYDGAVDSLDLSILVEDWLAKRDEQLYKDEKEGPGTDIVKSYLADGTVDPNSVVDMVDFASFAKEWGKENNPDDGLMVAKVGRILYDDPGDDYYPGTGSEVIIYNRSPADDAYWMNDITFKVGLNQGLGQFVAPEGWYTHYTSDPNEIRFDTDSHIILPGASKLFKLIAYDWSGQSLLSDFGFKIDDVEAKSDMFYDFTPIKAMLPVDNNP